MYQAEFEKYLINILNPNFSSVDQTLYNNAMIEFKNKNTTKPNIWLNALSRNPFTPKSKPLVPDNCIDVSDWDIEKIKEFTNYINEDYNKSKFKITYTNSYLLQSLVEEKKTLEGTITQIYKDRRFRENNTDNNFTIEARTAIIKPIQEAINEINTKITDEKNKLSKMSAIRGGKSRTKQHYRNKSNKRKSKKSKRKSIKKTNNRK